ncbi:hypothetical protein LP419_28945 [Massilia sp. H-1]|nr:hypothetical protein LP419_28945 [Massilia sp. H-1]
MLVALICFLVFIALYPSADFYLNELQRVTGRQPPVEANVVAQDATYPDSHGDYCSFARIQLNERSYNTLLDELKADERFIISENGELSWGGLTESNLQAATCRQFLRTR